MTVYAPDDMLCDQRGTILIHLKKIPCNLGGYNKCVSKSPLRREFDGLI